MKNILLLNPPSQKINYSRDYFCSKALKGNYVEHPIDILILSGVLFSSFNINILDATVSHLKEQQTLNEIFHFRPDYLIFITGKVSLKDDCALLQKVKARNKSIKLIGIGDVFQNNTLYKEYDWLDAVLYDFTTDDIVKYCQNDYSHLRNMAYRRNGEIIKTEITINNNQAFTIPVPRHELFLGKKYTFPFARHLPFTTILTDYGCAYKCSFCTYSTLGIKFRTIENVCEELEYIHSLGIREIFIKDQTFGWNKDRTIQLCKEMIKSRWNFSWTAFSRVDVIDKDLLSLMKDAGCHTLTFGVETANEDLLKKYNKSFKQEHIRNTFALCRSMSIETVGTFIIGFPNESRESILNTINFAKKLNCDFAAFNCFVPKPHCLPNNEYISDDYKKKETEQAFDQSGIVSIAGNGVLSKEEMAELLTYAVVQFYMRPMYLVFRILHLKSFTEFILFMKNGIHMMIECLKKKMCSRN